MPTTNDAVDSTLSSVHLDAIRGAAALVVLLGHTRDLFFSSLTQRPTDEVVSTQVQGLPQQPPKPFEPRITIGNEAVIIFFVLSGYLVGGAAIKALRRHTWSWKSYLIKRLTRLWVVLLPALLLGVALDHVGLHLFPAPTAIYAGPAQQNLVPSDVASHLTLPVIAGNAVFLQTILVGTAGTNDSLWSLANEFWYYLAFPALLLALWKGQRLWLRGIYLLMTAGILLLIGRSISLLFLVWMLGALLSVLPLRVPRSTAKIASGMMALLLPVVLIAVRRAPLSLYGAEWIVALAFTVTLYLVLHQTEKARKGMYQRVAGFFSRISYTLYLVHLPVAVLLCALINNPWHRWPKSPGNVAIFFLLNLTLVVVSYLLYLAFEANTDRVRNALFHRPMREKHLPTH